MAKTKLYRTYLVIRYTYECVVLRRFNVCNRKLLEGDAVEVLFHRLWCGQLLVEVGQVHGIPTKIHCAYGASALMALHKRQKSSLSACFTYALHVPLRPSRAVNLFTGFLHESPVIPQVSDS